MTWTFYLKAKEDRRMFSRILQVLDGQMVTIHSFHGEVHEAQVCISFVVSSEQDKAFRVEALLRRLQHILSVAVHSGGAPPSVTFSMKQGEESDETSAVRPG